MNELKSTEFYFFDPQLEPDQVIANYLFNRPPHLFLQEKKKWKVFGLRVGGKTTLQMAFHIDGATAQSPLKAPFGSLQSVGRITQEKLSFFLKGIEAFFKEREGKQRITIKNFPEAYQETNTKLLHANLTQLGFSARAEVSSIIEVDKEAFKNKIRISERQKLIKCKN